MYKRKLPHQLQSILLFCCILLTNTAIASFQKNSWPMWEVHNPLSQAVISHEEWQNFLNHCVVTNEEGVNLVTYPSLSETDLNLLENYIDRLSSINIHNYNRDEQLAYWVNLYNALTIQIVAEYYPVGSIQEIKISPGVFSVGPWGANLITVSGTQLSLDDIQNRIIRPIWNDPRTLYALNDASLGAANLRKIAFQGSSIQEQLNQAAREYVNSSRGMQIVGKKLVLSKLYYWFIDDFGGTELNLITHLVQHAKEPLRNQLQQITSVNSYIYNWHLNTTVAS